MFGDWQSGAESRRRVALAFKQPVDNLRGRHDVCGSVHLPLPSATSLLQGYVSQHGSDILASCATSNVTSGLTSKVPGAGSLPSIPKLP